MMIDDRRLRELTLVGDGEFEQRICALQVEFATNMRAVVFHCARADEQLIGNLSSRFIIGDQMQHSPFGCSQILNSR